jgi:hypothetical protein
VCVIRLGSSFPLNFWKFIIPWKLGFFQLLHKFWKGLPVASCIQIFKFFIPRSTYRIWKPMMWYIVKYHPCWYSRTLNMCMTVIIVQIALPSVLWFGFLFFFSWVEILHFRACCLVAILCFQIWNINDLIGYPLISFQLCSNHKHWEGSMSKAKVRESYSGWFDI